MCIPPPWPRTRSVAGGGPGEMLDAEDRQEMLAACGVTAQTPAGDLLVCPPEYPDPTLALAGD